LQPEARREVKRAAPADLALDPDPAAHQVHRPGRDAQAEAGAAVLARRRAARLGEGLEDQPQLLGRDADARVPHRKMQKDE
jgi:hypothetical protein